MYYTISINGQKAVDAGYKLCNGHCYTSFCGKRAQLEVVVDEPGTYNGISQKWVDCAYIKRADDIPLVLDVLRYFGFDGCKCIVSLCEQSGCVENQDELFCTII